MPPPSNHPEDLLDRIRGEYLALPGLRLTPPQARRLWGLDEQQCAELLNRLVDAGFLDATADGRYARRGEAFPGLPRPRAAKAEFADALSHAARLLPASRRA